METGNVWPLNQFVHFFSFCVTEGDFPPADEVPAGGSEDNCSTNESEKGQDKTNKIQKASTKKVSPIMYTCDEKKPNISVEPGS